MPLVMAIACIGMGMTPAEALVAGTLAAAWALERADRLQPPRRSLRRGMGSAGRA